LRFRRARRCPISGYPVPVRANGVVQLGRLGRSFPGSDYALWAAGLTFFGLIGIVPVVLVSLRVAVAVAGPAVVVAGVDAAIAGLPDGHGTPQALRTLVATAISLSWWQTSVALFPASLYGEGLRRAFLQLAPVDDDTFTGWRGRLGLLPVVAVAPLLVLALLAAAPWVGPLYAGGGWHLVLGVVVAFHVVWVLVSVALVLVYRFVAAGRVRTRALVAAGFATGAFLSGFLQGFVLFLAIPVEW
jgi:membrane protein